MFLRLFLSQNFSPEHSSLEHFHMDYARALTILPSASPAAVHALDSLSLVQVGSVHRDRTLLHEGVKAYTRALRSLAVALSRPNCQYDDNILAAATVLSLCEFYDEIKQQGHGWISHQRGMQKLIEARGPGSINSPLARLLYWHTVNSSVVGALMCRQTTILSTPEWHALEEKLRPDCAHNEVYEIGRALPELLQRHDRLDPTDPTILCHLDALIADCEGLEMRMRAYYLPYYTSASPLKPVDQFPSFFSAIPDHVLTHAHDFPSFMSAFMYNQYWLRTYYLRSNLHSLYMLRHKLVPDDAKPKCVEDAALLGVVLALCRSIPYFVDPVNGTVGQVSCFFPMHIAAYYFHARKIWRWLRWVRNVRANVFNRGLSIPVINLPPLPEEEEEERRNSGNPN